MSTSSTSSSSSFHSAPPNPPLINPPVCSLLMAQTPKPNSTEDASGSPVNPPAPSEVTEPPASEYSHRIRYRLRRLRPPDARKNLRRRCQQFRKKLLIHMMEDGRCQCVRKAPATRDIVPLTDASRKKPEWLLLARQFMTDRAGSAWDRCVNAW